MSLETLYIPILYGLGILIGLLSCFFGLKVFKLFLVFVFSFAGALLLSAAGYEFGDQPLLWSVAGFIAGGLIGALLSVFFFNLAIAVGGALLVTSLLLPWVETMEVGLQMALIAVGAAVGGLLAVFLTRLMIQLISAFLGAFLVVNGGRFFISGEPILVPVGELDELTVVMNLSQTAAIVAVVLGLVGFIYQRMAAK
jgi:hypothetical protein